MKISAITRYKNGELFRALDEAGWTVAELARRSKVCYPYLCNIFNLKKRAGEEVASKLQNAFGEVGVFFDVLEAFPPAFRGIKQGATHVQTEDVCPESISDPTVRNLELCAVLSDAVENLPHRERAVIEDLFYNGCTVRQIGKKYRVSPSRVYAIRDRAFYRLREKKNHLRDFVEV